MSNRVSSIEAYRLFHNGSAVFSQIESNGIRIDVNLLEETLKKVQSKVKRMKRKLYKSKVWRIWEKEFGTKASLGSGPQLAHILYTKLGIKPVIYTAKGSPKDLGFGKGSDGVYLKPSTSEKALEDVDHPFVKRLFRMKGYEKTGGTFLKGIKRELVGERVHPFFSLHSVRTMRSCIAEGTMIEIVRDLSKNPKGIPIEDVKEGDYAYCFDHNLNLCIRRVLWAGKTGHQKVLRLHWVSIAKTGCLDLTPEHEVRLINGEYVRVKDIEGADFRVLAMGRDFGRLDRIFPTGKGPMLDHRVVYESLIGNLEKKEVGHHIYENHFNNLPQNLQKMRSLSIHTKHHHPNGLPEEAKRRGNEIWKRKVAKSEISNVFSQRGPENVNWKNISKFSLLRALAEAKGKSEKTIFDFELIKDRAQRYNINLKIVKDRYDGNGRYISRGRLFESLVLGRSASRVYLNRGIPITRTWANQFGSFLPNNHRITKVEWINKFVDVYDLEIEEYHNFIANEICVHNSSSSPNFHNLPKRDEEMASSIRQVFIPEKGWHFWESDFRGAEVVTSASVTRDPSLIAYVTDPTKDMHRDTGSDIFLLPPEKVSKQLRYISKNMFVFASFYGSYFKQTSKSIWETINRDKSLLVDGIHVKEHLRRNGIRSGGNFDSDKETPRGSFEEHIREVERVFWNERFLGYRNWKKEWYEKFKRNGGFRTVTGFWIEGPMSKNAVLNYPIQGPSFHCLLWFLIQMQKWIKNNKMRTVLVGQIHDSCEGNSPPDEIQDVLGKAQDLLKNDLPKAFPWAIVPMGLEIAVAPIDKSWYHIKEWTNIDGKWKEKPENKAV